MRLCLDTSAYVRFKVGDRPAVERLDGAAWIGVPAIVVGELETGFRLGSQTARNLGELDAFLAHALVEEIAVDRDAARLYAEIVTDLRHKGSPIPTNDVWIAACAARTGSTLLTYDRHFEAVDRASVLVLPEA
jgi:predicted nucleic acid-binding protein